MKRLIALFLVLTMALSVCSAYAEDWTCPSCNNLASGNFCSNCGSQKPDNGNWTCASCGADATGKFCSNCGSPRATAISSVTDAPTASPAPTATPAPTAEPVVAPMQLEAVASADAAELLAAAKGHKTVSVNASPDKYTYYIQDYVGLNLSSIGYTSLGGDRLDRYGSGLLEICPVTLDGTYVDIESDRT